MHGQIRLAEPRNDHAWEPMKCDLSTNPVKPMSHKRPKETQNQWGDMSRIPMGHGDSPCTPPTAINQTNPNHHGDKMTGWQNKMLDMKWEWKWSDMDVEQSEEWQMNKLKQIQTKSTNNPHRRSGLFLTYLKHNNFLITNNYKVLSFLSYPSSTCEGESTPHTHPSFEKDLPI